MAKKKKSNTAEKKYTCPDCSAKFNPPDKINGKFCPGCGIELKIKRERKPDGPGFVFSYEAVSGSRLPVEGSPNLDSNNTKPDKSHEEDEGLGRLISEQGEVPKVWIVDEGEEGKNGLERYKATYRVRYEGIIHTTWVYCPNCNSPLFQNIMTSTGGADQKHLCRQSHCKATVLVGFMADLSMGSRTMIFNR